MLRQLFKLVMHVIAMPIFILRMQNEKRLFKTVVPKTTVILIAGIIPAQIKGRYIPNNL